MTDEDLPKLKFADRPVRSLVAGEKTATVRYDDEKGIETGDDLKIIGSYAGLLYGVLTVTHAETVPVEEALDVIEEHDSEYGVDSTSRLVGRLQGHYGPVIDRDTEVKVICFEVELI